MATLEESFSFQYQFLQERDTTGETHISSTTRSPFISIYFFQKKGASKFFSVKPLKEYILIRIEKKETIKQSSNKLGSIDVSCIGRLINQSNFLIHIAVFIKLQGPLNSSEK